MSYFRDGCLVSFRFVGSSVLDLALVDVRDICQLKLLSFETAFYSYLLTYLLACLLTYYFLCARRNYD